MSKTPEDLAKEYALKTHLGGWEVAASEDGFLAGYHAAKEHAHAALEEAEAEIDRLQTKLSEAGILTTEHLIDASKMVSNSATLNNWISTKDRLPKIEEYVLITHRTSQDYENLKVMQAFRINDCEYVIDIYSDGTCVLADYVDYWMLLPQPPKEAS